jgi:hypothetical protein
MVVRRHCLLTLSLVTGIVLLFTGACTTAYRLDGEGDDSEDAFEIINNNLEAKIDPEVIPPREPSPCPGLDSQLYQLIQSDDPALSATQIGMNVKDDKVQVLIILENDQADFLVDFDVELGTQSGNQLQAYVPFDHLCELANLDMVLAIRPVVKIFQ